jgi:hypothetical protein
MSSYTFEDFKANVVEEIKDFLPEKYADASVTIQDVTKNNDRQLSGLTIRTEDNNIAPTIYLEGFFQKYEEGADMGDILQEIADARVSHEIEQGFDAGRITDLDAVREHITCKLLNADMNKDYLSNKPHRLVEDFAVAYYVDLGGDATGHMSAPITDHLLDGYGIDIPELDKIAMENLANSDIEFKTMRDVLVEMMFPDGPDENDPRMAMLPPEEETPSMYVLTNADKMNGANSILDAKTMEDISEKIGGDFYILPSSLHEVIILPDTPEMDKDYLEHMVQDINAGQVAPEDKLSDHVYMYDSVEKEIVLADKMPERVAARENAHEDRKPERERVSMKEKLPEKKAEASKNAQNRNPVIPTKTQDQSL